MCVQCRTVTILANIITMNLAAIMCETRREIVSSLACIIGPTAINGSSAGLPVSVSLPISFNEI
jgi:hypothetical protein